MTFVLGRDFREIRLWPSWIAFVVLVALCWAGLLVVAVQRSWRMQKRQRNHQRKGRITTIAGVQLSVIVSATICSQSVLKLLWCVDSNAWYGLYSYDVSNVVLRLARLFSIASWFFIVLFWQEAYKMADQFRIIRGAKYWHKVVGIVMAVSFVLVLPLLIISATNLLSPDVTAVAYNTFFFVYALVLACTGVRYVVLLTTHLQSIDQENESSRHRAFTNGSDRSADGAEQSQPASKCSRKRSMSEKVSAMFRPSGARQFYGRAVFGQLVQHMRCVLTWALLCFVAQSSLALWRLCARSMTPIEFFVHNVLVHSLEIFLCCVALFAVRQTRRRRGPSHSSCIDTCCIKLRRNVRGRCCSCCVNYSDFFLYTMPASIVSASAYFARNSQKLNGSQRSGRDRCNSDSAVPKRRSSTRQQGMLSRNPTRMARTFSAEDARQNEKVISTLPHTLSRGPTFAEKRRSSTSDEQMRASAALSNKPPNWGAMRGMRVESAESAGSGATGTAQSMETTQLELPASRLAGYGSTENVLGRTVAKTVASSERVSEGTCEPRDHPQHKSIVPRPRKKEPIKTRTGRKHIV